METSQLAAGPDLLRGAGRHRQPKILTASMESSRRGNPLRVERVRWKKAWLEADATVAVEFWATPDVVPAEAKLDDQPDYIGVLLAVTDRHRQVVPGTTPWQRDALERHVAAIDLPFPHGGRPIRDAKPRRPPGVTAPARHLVDPDGS
jgi:hypothetical protein